MQWLNRNQKFNKTVFQKKKPQKHKRTKTKPHKSFLTVYVICQFDHFALYSLKSSGSSWGGGNDFSSDRICNLFNSNICSQTTVVFSVWKYLSVPGWQVGAANGVQRNSDPPPVRGKKNVWTWAWKHFSKNIWDCFYKDLRVPYWRKWEISTN